MFRFNPDYGSPENPSEPSHSDKERLRRLLGDSELMAKMMVLEMDLREGNTSSLEEAFHESLVDQANFDRFLDLCQSLIERLGEEGNLINNFLLAVVDGEVKDKQISESMLENLTRRIANKDFE